VELFASRSHFDYHDPAASSGLATWLRGSGLEMSSVYSPATEPAAEMAAALEMARHISFNTFVFPPDDNRDVAARNIETLHRIAEPLGVRLALEVMGHPPWTADALLDFIESDLDGMDLGVCMDVGHAFLSGDPADAIEKAGGYLLATHLHDNRRKRDDHLVPFQGGIAWGAVVMAFEKIGYDGDFMFELNRQQSGPATLGHAAQARKRLEDLAGNWELDAGGWKLS